MLFESDAGWNRSVRVAKTELQKECGLLKDELSVSQMTIQTDRLGLVKLGWEVVKKSKSLLEDVEALQRTVSHKNGAWEGLKKKLTQ